MTVGLIDDKARIFFEVPEGELRFGDGDLDRWAEHLAWCYRLLDLDECKTIAVQDFGTSPLAYLGSALLMPTLEAGIAERLDAKVICLDASPERVVLTPEVIRQVEPDLLIVRDEIFGLLLDGAKRAGVDLAALDGLKILVAIGAKPMPMPSGKWRRLLHVESTLLLAPECASCGHFHLRDGFYALTDGTIVNLLLDSAQPCVLPRISVAEDRVCELGPNDLLFTLANPGETVPS